MRKFVITENEKQHILGLYGLISEQQTNETLPSMNVTVNFKSGCHSNKGGNKCPANQVSTNIDPQIEKIKTFLKNAPKGKLIEVVLSAGESQVPNKDAEKTELPRLNPGELSKMRYQSLEGYLTQKFQEWIKEGIITSMPRFTKVEPVIGPTKWDPAKGADNPVYTKEQYLGVVIRVTNEPVTTQTTKPITGSTTIPDPGCAVGLTIRVYVESHNCQNAEFFIFANNTLLYNTQGGITANLNNANTSLGVPTSSGTKFSAKVLNPGYGKIPNGDGKFGGYKYGNVNNSGDISGPRSDTFVVTEEQSRKIISEGNGKIVIWMICTTKVAHRDIPNVVITKNIQGRNTVVYNDKPGKTEGKLLVLDACGDKLSEGGNDQKPDATQYLNQLKSLKYNIQKDVGTPEANNEETDTKQALLERSGDLRNTSYQLMNNILNEKYSTAKFSPNPKAPLYNDNTAKELSSLISTSFTNFNTLLDQQPSLRRNRNGRYESNFINPGIVKLRGQDMYGDVRYDMDDFYAIYDSIYVDEEGNVNPNGVSNTKGVLLLPGIISRLNNVKRKRFTLG